MAVITIQTGDKARRFLFKGGSVTIGRTAEASIQVNDVRVSPRHIQIARTKEGVFLVDLGSQTGTTLNGARVYKQLLKDGDVIEIGQTRITYQEGDPATTTSKRPGTGTQPAAKTATAGTRGVKRPTRRGTGGIKRPTTRRNTSRRISKTQKFAERAGKKGVHPLKIVIPLAVLALGVAIFFIIRGGGPDPLVQHNRLVKEARQLEEEACNLRNNLNFEQRIAKLEQAIEKWKEALKLVQENEPAKHLREIQQAKHEIARLEERIKLEKQAREKIVSFENRCKIIFEKCNSEVKEGAPVETLNELRSGLDRMLSELTQMLKPQYEKSFSGEILDKLEKEIRDWLDKIKILKPMNWEEYYEEKISSLVERSLPEWGKAMALTDEYIKAPLSERDKESAEQFKDAVNRRAVSEWRNLYGASPDSNKMTALLQKLGDPKAVVEHLKKERERVRGTEAEAKADEWIAHWSKQ